jgi:hypothetical protein
MSGERDRSLSYERSAGGISRWQFRLLLLLLVANLAITVQTAYAPQLASQVRQWWADRQAARKVAALQSQAWSWTESQGKVVWDDDPQTAAALLGGAGYHRACVPQSVVNGNYPFLTGWPPGAAANPPPAGSQLFGFFPLDVGRRINSPDTQAVAFLHGLRSPSGAERLVYVFLTGYYDIGLTRPLLVNGLAAPSTAFTAEVTKRLRLVAVPCLPATGKTQPLQQDDGTAELEVVPAGAGVVWTSMWDWSPPTGARPGRVTLRPQNRWRFYTGQPDPADASHFTFDYDLDGRRGTIHGRLKDDGSVELKPDVGVVTGKQWAVPEGESSR